MPPGEPSLERTAPRPGGGLARIARYALVRAAMLALMVVLSVYLAIVVLNYGGYIDKIREGAIEEALLMVSTKMPGASAEEIAAETARLRQEWQAQFGLDEPFLVRSLRWTYEALTFQWGESMFF
jgi:ABC-type dipeptide/oligopeptide/nickel transport system permease component